MSAMITAMLALAPKPGEQAASLLNYRFPLVPRAGDLISIQSAGVSSAGAKDYVVRRVNWVLPETASPSEVGDVDSVILECDPCN
jgi:hypothetical protein